MKTDSQSSPMSAVDLARMVEDALAKEGLNVKDSGHIPLYQPRTMPLEMPPMAIPPEAKPQVTASASATPEEPTVVVEADVAAEAVAPVAIEAAPESSRAVNARSSANAKTQLVPRRRSGTTLVMVAMAVFAVGAAGTAGWLAHKKSPLLMGHASAATGAPVAATTVAAATAANGEGVVGFVVPARPKTDPTPEPAVKTEAAPAPPAPAATTETASATAEAAPAPAPKKKRRVKAAAAPTTEAAPEAEEAPLPPATPLSIDTIP